MIILSKRDVERSLQMDETIEAMKDAFASFSSGKATVPLRSKLDIDPYNGLCLFMPAFIQDDNGSIMSLKVVSIYPDNKIRSFPTITASVLLLEASTGRPLAIVEGSHLTAIRTGAAAGAATDILSRKDCHTLAIFGAGVQARTQLIAISTVRDIETVWIFDPNHDSAHSFIQEMKTKQGVPYDIRLASNPKQAIENADIICTATTSPTPVFNDEDVKPGTHINGIGSFTPDTWEIPGKTVERSLLVVDSKEAALNEAGDIVHLISEKRITEKHIHAELGDIILGEKTGRTNDKQITFFKSVGIAVQDAFAARLATKNALEYEYCQRVTWE